MSDKTLVCCGQTFVGADRWRYVYEEHAMKAPPKHQHSSPRSNGGRFKILASQGDTYPGRG